MKSRTRKRREHPTGGSQPEEQYGLATRKNMFLDRPTSHGGWPEGEYDPPVSDRIYNYLKSMGMIQEHTRRYLTQIIREELQANLKESSPPRPYYPPGDPRNVSARPAAAPLKAIDPQLVTSEQRYRELTGILRQLVEKLIVIRRSSGGIQDTSFLAYDPLNKYIFLTWDESGSIAVKPSPLDDDFININRPTRALLTQLQALTFPTFNVNASAGGTYPNAFVSYVEPEGVRFTFPVGTDYLIFGNFRGEIDLCTVPSAQNEGPLMRKCARTKYVPSSDM